MKVIYTNHARDRLRERSISEKEIEEALRRGTSARAGDDLSKAVHENPKGMLAVIYAMRRTDKIVIITAYWEQNDEN